MLPTLNLQLSPVESFDDTLSTSLQPLPAAAGDGESGFADVLRLRVDATLTAESMAGELLPQGGSELPVLTDFAPTELANALLPAQPITTEIAVLQPESGPVIEAADSAGPPDLVLQTPVLYPPLEGPVDTTAEPLTVSAPGTGDAAAMAVPSLTVADPVRVASTVSADHANRIDTGVRQEGGPISTPQAALTSLAATAREANPLAPADGAAAPLPATVSSRELGQFRETDKRTAAIALTRPGADAAGRLPIADAIGRLDHAGLQRADRVPELTADTLQPRVLAQQPVQTPQAQPNVQFSPAQLNLQFSQAQLIPAASTAAVTSDVTYAGLTPQSSDLIGTSVRDSAWGSQLGERVVMMAGNQLKSAEIRLTPAELGPLRIQVAVDDGAANVTFHAQHAVTRDAIEQALPRLREMLAETGLSLGQADVSDRGVAEGDRDAGSGDSVSNLRSDGSEEVNADADRETRGRVRTSNGLVDTFA